MGVAAIAASATRSSAGNAVNAASTAAGTNGSAANATITAAVSARVGLRDEGAKLVFVIVLSNL